MTLFEYLAAGYTLVLSFAAIRLVGGLPSALQPKRRYWVHVVLVFGLLLSMASMFWGFWGFREANWNFPGFLLCLAGPALLFFMAATLIPEFPDRIESWETYYYSVRQRYFMAWMMWAVSIAAVSTVLLDTSLRHSSRLIELTMLAFALVGLSSNDRRVHAGLAIALVMASTLVAFTVFFEPGGPVAK